MGDGTVGWRPRDIAWRTATLFMVGSFCFALGAAPGFSSVAPTSVCGVVFFVGSLFFTSAGYSQFVQAINEDPPADGRRRLMAWQPTQRRLVGRRRPVDRHPVVQHQHLRSA